MKAILGSSGASRPIPRRRRVDPTACVTSPPVVAALAALLLAACRSLSRDKLIVMLMDVRLRIGLEHGGSVVVRPPAPAQHLSAPQIRCHLPVQQTPKAHDGTDGG